jgi:hypothetical protein
LFVPLCIPSFPAIFVHSSLLPFICLFVHSFPHSFPFVPPHVPSNSFFPSFIVCSLPFLHHSFLPFFQTTPHLGI